YMTLEWPMEDAWVNYNSLQQLMYFIIVFIAAPVAAITGVRMSEWWPKDAAKLNKIYPAPLARALHFPTMLFFVFFILVHVFLVFATGMRQNLGYMFAGTNVVGWAGLIWFIVAMVVVVAGWFAARPLLMAPSATGFGGGSSRSATPHGHPHSRCVLRGRIHFELVRDFEVDPPLCDVEALARRLQAPCVPPAGPTVTSWPAVTPTDPTVVAKGPAGQPRPAGPFACPIPLRADPSAKSLDRVSPITLVYYATEL